MLPASWPELTDREQDWVPAPRSIYRLNVDQYEAMVASGALNQRDRFHLINGILVTKMTKKPLHVIACERVRDALIQIASPGWRVTTEAPIRIPAYNEPEPDVAVVKGSAEGEEFEERHPEPADVAMVVEVADSSLSEDRDVVHVYGAAGIPILWIVNLVERQVEVYSVPGEGGHQSRQDFKPGQIVPIIIDGSEVGGIAVSDILPRRRS